MHYLDQRWISLVTFLPLLAALALLLIPSRRERLVRHFTLGATLATFVLSLPLYFEYARLIAHASPAAGVKGLFLFEVPLEWISAFSVHYLVGVDGISLLLVLLTTFLGPICALSAYRYITVRVKQYMIAMLLLQFGMTGVFVALDMFLFYVFWELMLIPMYLIIGVWGGPRRIYAAVKFFVYTMVGSVLMLAAILYLYKSCGSSFDYFELAARTRMLGATAQLVLFAGFALAFAIKVPMFPFHTWLPDAHVEAPTAGSVILAGVMLKMGTYGFLRFAIGLFPGAAFQAAPLISMLAVIGIVYGALVAMVQPDVKKLVAYSSVSHLGFVMLGMFAFNTMGMQGSVLQMINHGISTGGLFLLVGMLYERRHTRMIRDFGGLGRVVPVFAVFLMILTLSSIGLPGTNGFTGEFLILLGSFRNSVPLTVAAATGVVLAAVYMLWMYQRVMFGEVTNEANAEIEDMRPREWAYMLPLVLMVFWIGLHPNTFLALIEPSVNALLQQIGVTDGGAAAQAGPALRHAAAMLAP
ncbi:MAG: NADH-quinone oxidoreductase subunit M [Candidatus Alcyoniella australis]|nr:NADH-quinone oxidoreductase subunit M [Candidatus Alcyoniella australis]